MLSKSLVKIMMLASILLIVAPLNARSAENLKGLDVLCFGLSVEKGVLKNKSKILSTYRSRLRSLGIKVIQEECQEKPVLLLRVEVIKSSFAAHRVLAMLILREDTIILSKPFMSDSGEELLSSRSGIQTPSITYFDEIFFKTSTKDELETKLFDELLLRFEDRYSSSNI